MTITAVKIGLKSKSNQINPVLPSDFIHDRAMPSLSKALYANARERSARASAMQNMMANLGKVRKFSGVFSMDLVVFKLISSSSWAQFATPFGIVSLLSLVRHGKRMIFYVFFFFLYISNDIDSNVNIEHSVFHARFQHADCSNSKKIRSTPEDRTGTQRRLTRCRRVNRAVGKRISRGRSQSTSSLPAQSK